MSQKARDVALNYLHEQRFQFQPYELIALCLEFSIKKLFVPAFFIISLIFGSVTF